jgi:tetratricopeptide (TPR) repeat protein
MRLALENIRANPLRYLVQMRFKIASLLQLQTRDYATGQLITVSPLSELVAVNGSELPLRDTVLADLQYVLIVLLAIVGLWFAAEPRRTAPVLLFIAYCTALSALTIGHPRLRLPILAVLIPYAAYALARAPAALRHIGRLLRDRRAWAVAGCWIVFAALIFTMRFVPWLRAEPLAAQARAYRDKGDLARAGELFARARERDPQSPMRLFDEADSLLSRGQIAEARQRYEQGELLEPRSLYGRAMLAATHVLQGDEAGARAELARVREAGYDRDDLWAWVWRRAGRRLWPLPIPQRLVPGDPAALGFAVGFAPATADLAAGRWTQGAAQIRLAGRCGLLSLALRGPRGRVARVTTDAGAALEVALTGAAQTVTLPVVDAAGRCGDALLVSIESPTDLLDIETDPWQVGVAVSEVRLDIR